jgi:hypothetical protein
MFGEHGSDDHRRDVARSRLHSTDISCDCGCDNGGRSQELAALSVIIWAQITGR